MKNSNKTSARSDVKSKSKSKQRSERYNKYKSYIRSKKFEDVKKIVKERDGYKCAVCDRSSDDGVTLSCHHKTYKHLFEGGEIEANDCILLCCKCHMAIHRSPSNYKWFSMEHPRNNGNDDRGGEEIQGVFGGEE